MAQHVLGAFLPIIRSLQLHYQPLVLPLERGGSSVVGRGLTDHDQQRCNRHAPTVKPDAICSCKLLMMGKKATETC